MAAAASEYAPLDPSTPAAEVRSGPEEADGNRDGFGDWKVVRCQRYTSDKVVQGIAYCPTLCCLAGLAAVCAVIGIGFAMNPPEIQTDFSTFTKAVTNSSLTSDVLKAALEFRKSGRVTRRLADDAEEWMATQSAVAVNSSRRLQQAGDSYYGPAVWQTFDLYLAYELKEDSDKYSIFDDEVLRAIGQFEQRLRNFPEWRTLCQETGETGGSVRLCDPGISLISYAMPEVNTPDGSTVPNEIVFNGNAANPVPLDMTIRLVYGSSLGRIIFMKDFEYTTSALGRDRNIDYLRVPNSEMYYTFRDSSHKKGLFRSVFRWKFLAGYQGYDAATKEAAQNANKDKWNAFAEFIIEELKKPNEEDNTPFNVFFDGTDFTMIQVWTALMSDSLRAIGSFSFVMVYLLYHTRSVILAISGVVLMGMAVPLAYVTYAWIAGSKVVSIANFLSLFVIVGIGADDVFVYTDFWQASAKEIGGGAEVASEKERVKWTLYHAAKASIATSITTAMAFFGNLFSVLKPLREFGLFMGLCVIWLWVIVTLVYLPILVIDYRYFSWARLDCAKCRNRTKQQQALIGANRKALNWWANTVYAYRSTLFGTACLAAVVSVAMSAAMMRTDLSVPNIFPKGHNLGIVPEMMKRFGPTEEVMPVFFREPQETATVCDPFTFTRNDNLCASFWCTKGEELPGTECRCYRQQADGCIDPRYARVTARVITPKTMEDQQKDEFAAWLRASQSGADFENWEERRSRMRSVYRPSAYFDGGENSDYLTVNEMDIWLKRRSGSCGWKDVCFCGVTCQESAPGVFSASPRMDMTTPARRLDDHEEFSEQLLEYEEDELDMPLALLEDTADVQQDELGGMPAAVHPRRLQTQWRVPRNKRATINVVFGIKANPDAKRLLGELPDDEKWSFDPDFNPAYPWAQRSLVSLCDKFPEPMRVAQRNCWPTVMKRWLEVQDFPFPVRPLRGGDDNQYSALVFQFLTSQRVGGRLAEEFAWIRIGVVQATFVEIKVDMDKDMDAADALVYKRLWDAYIQDYNRFAPPYARNAWHISNLWVRGESQQELLASTATTLLVIIIFSFLSMLVFTKDLTLACFVVTSTLWVVIELLFFMVVVLRFKIGAIEVIALIAFIGYALDYSFHIAHEYSHREASPDGQRPFKERKDRTVYSLTSIGGAALGSAATTFGASIFLLFCTLTLFPKLGAVVMFVTAISIVGAFMPLSAALFDFGPLRPGHTFDSITNAVKSTVRSIINTWDAYKARLAEDDEPKLPEDTADLAEDGNDARSVKAKSTCSVLSALSAVALAVFAVIVIVGVSEAPPAVDRDFGDLMISDGNATVRYNGFQEALRLRNTERISGMTEHEHETLGASLYSTVQIHIVYQLANNSHIPQLFNMDTMRLIGQIEQRLRDVSGWTSWCERAEERFRGDCEPGMSLYHYMFATADNRGVLHRRYSDPRAINRYIMDGRGDAILPLKGVVHTLEKRGLLRVLLPEGVDPAEPENATDAFNLTDVNATFKTPTYENTTAFRSVFRFRIRCCAATATADEQASFQEQLKTEWTDFVEESIVPILKSPFPDLEDRFHPLQLWYNATYLEEVVVKEVLGWDSIAYAVACVILFLVMLVATRSILLSVIGLMVGLIAVGLGYLIMTMLTDGVNLAVFPGGALLILASTADMMFVYTDQWRSKTSANKFIAIRRAATTTLAGTLVGALAGLCCLRSVLPALRSLGILLTVGLAFAWLLVTVCYAPFVALDERVCARCRLARREQSEDSQGTQEQILTPQRWARYVRRWQQPCLVWSMLIGFLCLILSATFARAPVPDTTLRIHPVPFRWYDNNNEGVHVLKTFAPVGDEVVTSSGSWRWPWVWVPHPSITNSYVQELDESQAVPTCSTWSNAPSGNCGFYSCFVEAHSWETYNRSNCDCTRRANSACGDAATTPTAQIVQKFFGYNSTAVGLHVNGGGTQVGEYNWESFADGRMSVTFPSGQALQSVEMRSVPPMLVQQWESGAIGVELGLQLTSTIPRNDDDDSCGYQEVCQCGAHRCADLDFTLFKGKDCRSSGVIDVGIQTFFGTPRECAATCRSLPGCTGFVHIEGKNVYKNSCIFRRGSISRYPDGDDPFANDLRSCWVRAGDHVRRIDNFVSHGDFQYATIDNVRPHAALGTDRGWSVSRQGMECQNSWNKQAMPDGWELVPGIIDDDGYNLTEFIGNLSWSTRAVVLGNGRCFNTNQNDNDKEFCLTASRMLGSQGGTYFANKCYMRVLIRRRTGLSYVGCFRDDRHRDFQHGPREFGWQKPRRAPGHGSMFDPQQGYEWTRYNTATCRTACHGYKYFALQENGFCQCGNMYASEKYYTRQPDGECGGPCSGEETLPGVRRCGGFMRNAVYRVAPAVNFRTGEAAAASAPSWTRLCTSCRYESGHPHVFRRPQEEVNDCLQRCQVDRSREEEAGAVPGSESVRACQSRCRDSRRHEEVAGMMSLTQCKEACAADLGCVAINYGKGNQAESCVLVRFDNQGDAYHTHNDFDVYLIRREPWLSASMRRMQERSQMRLGPRQEQRMSTIEVVFGLDVPDSSKTFGGQDEIWRFNTETDFSDPATQLAIEDFCEQVFRPEFALRITQKWCWMQEFRAWLSAQGKSFPVEAANFHTEAMAFIASGMVPGQAVGDAEERADVVLADEPAKSFVWVRNNEVKGMYISFEVDVDQKAAGNSKAYYYSVGRGLVEFRELWDRYQEWWQNRKQMPSFHTSVLWAQAQSVRQITSSTFAVVGFALVVTFAVASAFTCHLSLALGVAFSALWAVLGVALFLFVVMQRTLGPVEAIALSMCACVAGVPSLQVAHLYNQRKVDCGDVNTVDKQTATAVRFLRVRSSLVIVAGSRTFAMISTVLLAFALAASQFQALQIIAGAVIMQAVMAAFTALGSLPAALYFMGPLGKYSGVPVAMKVAARRSKAVAKSMKIKKDPINEADAGPSASGAESSAAVAATTVGRASSGEEEEGFDKERE